MTKLLKPGQLCTIEGKVYRCSKRKVSPCVACYSHYGKDWSKTPCKYMIRNISACEMLFGETYNGESSFPILVSK